jgi:hypothetical protein
MTKFLALTLLWTLTAQALAKAAVNTSSFLPIPDKPRVFILSDISNEPDDQESLTRYLLYANQFQTEGICAVTSTWLTDEVHPEAMLSVMNAYGNVTDNLNRHAPPDSPYPSGDHIRSLLREGAAVSAFKIPDRKMSQRNKFLIISLV